MVDWTKVDLSTKNFSAHLKRLGTPNLQCNAGGNKLLYFTGPILVILNEDYVSVVYWKTRPTRLTEWDSSLICLEHTTQFLTHLDQ